MRFGDLGQQGTSSFYVQVDPVPPDGTTATVTTTDGTYLTNKMTVKGLVTFDGLGVPANTPITVTLKTADGKSTSGVFATTPTGNTQHITAQIWELNADQAKALGVILPPALSFSNIPWPIVGLVGGILLIGVVWGKMTRS
jgi:hypothetical protein